MALVSSFLGGRFIYFDFFCSRGGSSVRRDDAGAQIRVQRHDVGVPGVVVERRSQFSRQAQRHPPLRHSGTLKDYFWTLLYSGQRLF